MGSGRPSGAWSGPIGSPEYVSVVLTAIDLANRDSVEVAGGSKIVWGIALLVMPAGSIVYLWFGRKRTPRS